MNPSPPLLILGLTLLGCTGDKGPSGAAASADDVASALASNAAIEAAINERVALEVRDFIVANRDGLQGPEGAEGQPGQPGEPGPQGTPGTPGETGRDGQDATRWKLCGISAPTTADRAGSVTCQAESACTSARICTVDELLAGAIAHQGDLTATGTAQTNYLRQVGQQLIADGAIDAENPYAFVHSGFWSSSCQNYSEDGAQTQEAFGDDLVDLKATVWPLIQLSVAGRQEDDSSANAVSARHARCSVLAPVLCCDADGRPEAQP